MVRLLPRGVTVLLLILLAAGCRDREIVSYRAPKDPAATPAAGATPGSGQASAELPEGHPPVDGGSSAPGGAPAGDMARMANTAVPTASGNDLKWSAPAEWAPKPGSAMRKGSYAVKGPGGDADLAITAFPGDTGGLEANLNRWRGQVGLPPQAGAELTGPLEKFTAHGLEITVADYTGPNGTRLLGAIVPFQGNTWFFKLMGPDATVAPAKPGFLEFLRTIQAPTS